MIQHSLPFDPTYGYSEADLRAITPPPIPDPFEAFWRETRAIAEKVAPDVKLTPIPSSHKNLKAFEIEFTGIGGFRVGGWLTRPIDVQPQRGVVFGHGYDGRESSELVSGPPAVTIFPCARGFHRSRRPDLPCSAGEHVIYGIDSPETYIHRHCVADLWSAVNALLEVAPEVAGCIDYNGTSFGGGIGAMALPWEPRFRRAYLGVPSFGHHDIRLKLPCVGSGEAVRQLYLKKPQIRETLKYFDSAVSAQFCRIPVMVACALFDPAVPPPGQFAVYNSLAGTKSLFVRQADHFETPNSPLEGARIWREQNSWFAMQAPGSRSALADIRGGGYKGRRIYKGTFDIFPGRGGYKGTFDIFPGRI